MKNNYTAIIDYGLGNTGSVQNMLLKIGVKSIITNDFSEIRSSSRLILPGIGSFDNAVNKLHKLGLFELINEYVILLKKPILGICLGMQLLGISSEEGIEKGFGFLKTKSLSFNSLNFNNLIVPNIGWRDVGIVKPIPFTANLSYLSRFYFVHSYYIPFSEEYSILTSEHGILFSASVNKDNIFGVQFHPEKSHKYGIQILKNFTEINSYDQT